MLSNITFCILTHPTVIFFSTQHRRSSMTLMRRSTPDRIVKEYVYIAAISNAASVVCQLVSMATFLGFCFTRTGDWLLYLDFVFSIINSTLNFPVAAGVSPEIRDTIKFIICTIFRFPFDEGGGVSSHRQSRF